MVPIQKFENRNSNFQLKLLVLKNVVISQNNHTLSFEGFLQETNSHLCFRSDFALKLLLRSHRRQLKNSQNIFNCISNVNFSLKLEQEFDANMAGPVVQGIDTLASAMKGNIIPDQEYLLQGSLLDSHIEVFKHRLRGLCDNTLGGEEQFCEREMVFSIRGTSAQPLSLRVRKTENLGAPSHLHRDSDTPWQLRYLGQGYVQLS